MERITIGIRAITSSKFGGSWKDIRENLPESCGGGLVQICTRVEVKKVRKKLRMLNQRVKDKKSGTAKVQEPMM